MTTSRRDGIRLGTREEGPDKTLSSLRATGPEAVFEAGGHGKAIARAMYHPELIRHPDSCPALVLNADYTPLSYYPLSLWPWQTAVKAMFLERVDIVAHYDREVHSPSHKLKLPSVIALRQFVRPNEHPAFTPFNLLLRDRFRCVYCGPGRELTLDHVRPRAHGCRTTCDHLATACPPCNLKKAGRTPRQADMHIHLEPF